MVNKILPKKKHYSEKYQRLFYYLEECSQGRYYEENDYMQIYSKILEKEENVNTKNLSQMSEEDMRVCMELRLISNIDTVV